jgi:putative ABC transport system permease protein
VGAFIIFNTFTILVTQRTREFGLLRAMGATGSQVIVSVIVEAAVLGILASAAGLAVGFGLAGGLLALVEAFGRTVPSGPLVLTDRTVIAAFAVGIVATVGSSTWPAVRAARVPPVAAIDDVTVARSRPFRLRAAFGTLLTLGGIPALLVGLDRTRHALHVVSEIWLVALGAFLVLFGVIVLLAAFARPLTALLGRPLRAVDVTGGLARGNAMRNPRRTAATASALVIGLALVGLVAVFGDSAKASVRTAVDRGIRADIVVKAEQFAGFSPQVEQRIRAVPRVAAVAAFRFGNVRIDSKAETVAGVDPAVLDRVVDLRLSQGSVGAMGVDGMLVHADAARAYHLAPGDTVEMQFPRGFAPVVVAGIYRQKDFTGGFPVSFIVARPTYDSGFGTDQQDSLAYVRSDGPAAPVKAALQHALRRTFPNLEVFTRAEYRNDQVQQIDRFLAVVIALLLLSELIAVLGIVNTLALSVHERTHELGLLRAVGMSRRQMRRMIRSESALVALVGGLVGTGIGVLWGWVFTTALRSQGITRFSVPSVQVAGFLVLSMAAGVVAALGPAWRASRLDVLDAIATE